MRDVVILSGKYAKETLSRPDDINSEGLILDPAKFNHYRSMGAYQIAHHLRGNGISTQVIDYVQFMPAGIIIHYVNKFLKKDAPSILGISTTFISNDERLLPPNILEVVKYVKDNYPLAKIVLGGALAHKFNLKNNHIDYAIYSYAEDVTLKLFNGILGREPMDINFKLNKKLMQDNTVYDITHCNHRFTDDDCIREGETLPIEISRGCIFKCRFCKFPYIGKKKNDYIRDMNLVKEEMLYNYEKFGTTKYYVLDDTFNETPDKITAFCKAVAELPFKIEFCAYLRLDLIHRFPETAKQMYDAGLRGAFFGVESFHPEAAKVVGKGWSGDPAKEFILKLKNEIWEDKVNITLSLIIGLPPEQLDHAMETNKWCAENGIHNWSWHVLSVAEKIQPDSSEFERNPEKYGFTITGRDYHNGYNSREEIVKWYETLANYPARGEMRNSSWAVFEFASYFSMEEALNVKYRDIRSEKLMTARYAWFRKYIDKLNTLE